MKRAGWKADRWILVALGFLTWGSILEAQPAADPSSLAQGTTSISPLPATGIETVGNIIIDYRNSSITIKTTPSKHREIEKLLELLTEDPLAEKDVRVASFDLLNLTPDQFRDLIRFHKPTLNPNDSRRFHIEQAPEHRGMTNIIPAIPQVSATTGGSSAGGGGGP